MPADVVRGSGIITWVADGKLKFRFFESQDAMVHEVARLALVIPRRLMFVGLINWDDETVDPFTSDEDVLVES